MAGTLISSWRLIVCPPPLGVVDLSLAADVRYLYLSAEWCIRSTFPASPSVTAISSVRKQLAPSKRTRRHFRDALKRVNSTANALQVCARIQG